MSQPPQPIQQQIQQALLSIAAGSKYRQVREIALKLTRITRDITSFQIAIANIAENVESLKVSLIGLHQQLQQQEAKPSLPGKPATPKELAEAGLTPEGKPKLKGKPKSKAKPKQPKPKN